MATPPDPHSSRGQALSLLRRRPCTAGELAEDIGISPQAVRDQLRALEAEGLVEVAGMRRDTGGKPAREYALTAAGEEAFGKAYGGLLRHLVAELHDRFGEEVEREVLKAAGRRAAAGVAPGTPPDPAPASRLSRGERLRRLEAAVSVLDALGGAAEVEEMGDTGTGAGLRIRSDGCPLSAVVRARPEACALAEGLVETLTGLRVREACDRSGRPRCAFEIERATDSTTDSATVA